MKRPTKLPQAPAHLQPETREWWATIVSRYECQSHHLKLLQAAAESWDLYQKAKAVLDAEGLTYTDRWGQPTARPEVGIMRDAKLAFVRILRELNLTADEPGK
jgi:P27 family predicted phage terminase small subunit